MFLRMGFGQALGVQAQKISDLMVYHGFDRIKVNLAPLSRFAKATRDKSAKLSLPFP